MKLLKKKAPHVAKVLNHQIPLAGPAGRFGYGLLGGLGVLKFSKNQKMAKEFLRYIFKEERYNTWLKSAKGYSQPLLRSFDNNPVWGEDPKLIALKGIGKWIRPLSWPAPHSGSMLHIVSSSIIPDMFSEAITGKATTQESIKGAEKKMTEIIGGGGENG